MSVAYLRQSHINQLDMKLAKRPLMAHLMNFTVATLPKECLMRDVLFLVTNSPMCGHSLKYIESRLFLKSNVLGVSPQIAGI